MGFALKDNGTEIDEILAPIVKDLFPDYEKIWSNYIGCESDNRGITKAVTIAGIRPDLEKIRRLVGQYNYIILLNYFHLHELVGTIPQYSSKTFAALERIYILSINIYYNAMECISKVIDLIKDRKNENPFKDSLYELRNMLVHELRPLVYLKSNSYNVLKPESIKTLTTNDTKSLIWSDLDQRPDDFIELSLFIERLKLDLNAEFQILLGKVSGKFRDMKMPRILPVTTPLKSRKIELDNTRGPAPSAAVRDDEIFD